MFVNSRKRTSQRKVIFDGNSLSTLSEGNIAGGQRYPVITYASLTGAKLGYQNMAVSGYKTSVLYDTFADRIGNNSNPGDILVMMEIINEARSGFSSQDMYDNYVLYARQAIDSYGLIVIMLTCPMGKLITDLADTCTRALATNAMIRADHSFCNGFADVGAIAELSTEAGITNATYYNADRVHLTNIGYDLINPIVKPVIESFL